MIAAYDSAANGTNRPLKAAGGCWTTELRAKRPKEVQTAAQFSRTLLERTRERENASNR